MVGGENVGCNEGELLHLLVVGLVHGAFQTHVYEFLRESGVLQTILNEYFHAELYFCVDIGDR